MAESEFEKNMRESQEAERERERYSAWFDDQVRQGKVAPRGVNPSEWQSSKDRIVADGRARQEDALARQRIADMMNGTGLPTADELYAGAAQGINAQAFNIAGAQAADLANSGVSRSGYQQRAVNVNAQQRGAALANAKTDSTQKANQLRTDAFTSGQAELDRLDDKAQRARIVDKLVADRTDYDAKNNPEKDWFTDMGRSDLNPWNW